MTSEKQLILLLWVPVTIGIFMFIIGDLLWAFGNTCLIADYYTSRFSGPLEANLWILDLVGPSAWILGIVLLICYFKLTFYLFKK